MLLGERNLNFDVVLAPKTSWEQLATDYTHIIIMGGPQSVYEDNRFPYLRQELGYLAEMKARGTRLLGICLGAQLLARLLGARVYKGKRREIGWGNIQFTPQAAADPLFRSFGAETEVFHWHGDTFDLPQGAVLLAASPVTPHQAFSFNNQIWGVQFHVEIMQREIPAWVQANQNDAADIPADLVEASTQDRCMRLNQLAAELLKGFLG